MSLVETGQAGLFNGPLEAVVLKLGHFAALGAYHVVMRAPVITLFILRRIAELMLDD